MKLFLAAFLFASLSHAGNVGPFIYTFGGDPTGVTTDSINPDAGSVIIDKATTHRAIKISPRGDNSTYAGEPIVINSGTTALTLSGTAVATNTIATLPAGSGSFVVTGVDVLCLASSGVTSAPTFVIQSGTGTLLTGTITLSTTANASTVCAPASPTPLVITTSNSSAPLEIRTITTGTATSITGKVFVRGYFIP